jgi:hypothetical protein
MNNSELHRLMTRLDTALQEDAAPEALRETVSRLEVVVVDLAKRVCGPRSAWWIVTLREDGDDEDSLLVVQADDEDTAVATAQENFAAALDREEPPTIYINHVVRCVGAEPEHVRTVQL